MPTRSFLTLLSVSPLLASIGLVGSWFISEARAAPPPPPDGAPGDHDGHGGHRGPPREPPPFAFAACDDKAAGDACTVQLRDKSLTGTCTAFEDDRVYCHPANMPPPPRALPSDGPEA